MKRLLIALLFLPAIALGDSWGQLQYKLMEDRLGERVTPYGEQGVYQLDPVFNYLTTYGLTDRHDIQTTSGGGTIAASDGFIRLESGTGTGDNALLQTVRPGIYAAGRTGEAGQGILPEALPAANSTAYLRWGAYTINNAGNIGDGIVYEITDDDSDGNLELCFSYYANATERERVCGIERVNGEPQIDEPGEFNGEDLPANFDPFTEGFVSVSQFNWYGIGGATARMYYPEATGDNSISEWEMHSFSPERGQAFRDPNLYLRQEANAGDSGANVALEVGGRRYDVTGLDERDSRKVGEFRIGQSIGDGTLSATVCVRRKSEFPAGSGRENTVTALARSINIITDAQVTYYVAAVDTVSGGTWAAASNQPTSETGLEFNTGVTGFGTTHYITGPLVALGTQNNKQSLTGEDLIDLPLRDTEPMCVLAQGQGATATIDTYFNMVERQ